MNRLFLENDEQLNRKAFRSEGEYFVLYRNDEKGEREVKINKDTGEVFHYGFNNEINSCIKDGIFCPLLMDVNNNHKYY